MARSLVVPKISSPPGQLFECRDCPARCCRLPASIGISDDEARRFLAEPWVRDRAGAEGVRVLEGGRLPVREVDRSPQCVFLDDDRLCGMQKRFGHAFLSQACQAFPFAFTQGEKGVIVAQLSQVCPSIRDNYGLPVEKQVHDKLAQQGGEAAQMSPEMGTLGGIGLSQTQYLRVARRWEEELAATASPAITMARLLHLTLAFEGALPAGVEQATDAAVDQAMRLADESASEPLVPRKSPSWPARVMFAYLLGYLCYPTRLKLAHRIGEAPAARLSGWRSLANKLFWMLGRGT
jgi:lysine-N-methylase